MASPRFSTESYTEYCDNVSCQGFPVRYEISGEHLFEHSRWVGGLDEMVSAETGTKINVCEICGDALAGNGWEFTNPM